jgi:transposase InsO family protein
MSQPTIKLRRRDAVAHFRADIVGSLARCELDHGQLIADLRTLSKKRFRPPGSKRTRTYSVPTLQRWYYRYRSGGVEALKPRRRSDAGRGQALTAEQRELLLDIRAEHPQASVPLILRTLELARVFPEGLVGPQTVRRLYREAAMPRQPRASINPELDEVRQRLRWQAPYVCSLWHGDVCHALKLVDLSSGKTTPVLVHAMLDDHSRYIIRIEVRETEREQEMLEILANAVREHGGADRLYLDNGATYSGNVLSLVCERLGMHLLHARPGDAPARGKMERLFRTMREQCIDHIRGAETLHDVYVRLLAWREQYHRTPHSSLMGRTPEQVWREGVQSIQHQRRRRITEDELREAYVMRSERRVRKDSTLSLDGRLYEVDASWLASKKVMLVRSFLAPDEPHVEFEGHRFSLRTCDPEKNARRHRKPPKRRTLETPKTDFRPADVALDAMLGRDNQENV